MGKSSTNILLSLLNKPKPPKAKVAREEQSYVPETMNRSVLPGAAPTYLNNLDSHNDLADNPAKEKDIQALINDLRKQLEELKGFVK